jgi:peptidoglycan/xylan/chitin deacetylase (PgdA/CDA1 family)
MGLARLIRHAFGLLLAAAVIAIAASPLEAASPRLIEVHMRLASDRGPPTVALTFDACGGKTDRRILDLLVRERIPATIFVTSIWLRRNPEGLALLLANPGLFGIENHGRHHVPAVDRAANIFGLKAAGSAQAVAAEIEGGREDIIKATGRTPQWYRGAAAVYTGESLDLARHLGQRIAGFSIAADGGALLSRSQTSRRIAAARDGDILLMHINHPERRAGQGVAEGLLELKRRGYRFVRLDSPGVGFEPENPK